MTHDYKSALENFKGYAPYLDLYDSTEAAILHALKLADKVTGEPSEGMLSEGFASHDFMAKSHKEIMRHCGKIFKAMIAKQLKEIDDAN